jgi:hypothetical protein
VWELDLVERDPTRHNVKRLANAARFTIEGTTGTDRDIAQALAVEIEALRERFG